MRNFWNQNPDWTSLEKCPMHGFLVIVPPLKDFDGRTIRYGKMAVIFDFYRLFRNSNSSPLNLLMTICLSKLGGVILKLVLSF